MSTLYTTGLVFFFMLCFIGYVVGTRFGWDAGVAAAMWTYLMMPQIAVPVRE